MQVTMVAMVRNTSYYVTMVRNTSYYGCYGYYCS